MDRYLYEETRLNLVRRSRNFAVASLSCSIILFNVPFIAIGLGFLAILFAFLSKGYRPKMDKEAVTAVKFAIVGIVVGILFFCYMIGTSKLFNSEEGSVTDSFYGETYNNEFNMTPSELFNKYFGGSINE
ncbi:MAG: hypothetical protein IKR39_08785 [Lachnospiraceae bacterium]|nr:hypothetical protein [Lachnospiraceae bacterium]